MDVNENNAIGFVTGQVSEVSLTILAAHCPAPAPLVVNGSPYVGCQLDAGHEGPHSVTATWAAR